MRGVTAHGFVKFHITKILRKLAKQQYLKLQTRTFTDRFSQRIYGISECNTWQQWACRANISAVTDFNSGFAGRTSRPMNLPRRIECRDFQVTQSSDTIIDLTSNQRAKNNYQHHYFITPRMGFYRYSTGQRHVSLTQNLGRTLLAQSVYQNMAIGFNRHLSSSATQYVDTIYALSSGQGKCGVAVLRVSGPEAGTVLQALGGMKSLPTPRVAQLRMLKHPATAEPLDKALVLWFPGPGSFTGEDSCEFQVHGGPAVVVAVLDALGSLPGLRHAVPGEYTRRAFANGKLDLTEVEGLADLIHAETEAQRRQALRQMDGELGRLYTRWRQTIVKCSADIAAFIDFSEDELIEDDVLENARLAIETLCCDIQRHLEDKRRGERLRDGVRVTIVGEPNVGKSSLLNILCRRPAAIVSPMAGTTRDVVESAINLGGYPALLTDTAGLRHATTDPVEREGVRRALQRAIDADLRVITIDARKLPTEGHIHLERLLAHHLKDLGLSPEAALKGGTHRSESDHRTRNSAATQSISAEMEGAVNLNPEQTIVVLNKSDLLDASELRQRVHAERLDWCLLSCVTEEGMESFLDILTAKVKEMCANPSSDSASLTQARHRIHLEQCLQALKSFSEDQHSDLVMAGERLRIAAHQIGKLTGRITSEEILDVVFRDFCIGK